MSLIELIIDLMLSDDDCVAKQSEYLQEIYAKSTNKTELDEAFVCLWVSRRKPQKFTVNF